MENKHTELIIGYLQGNLTPEETNAFYGWVNESTSNKELFFEIKAMYDAGRSLGKPIDTASSWQYLLNKKKNSLSLRFNFRYQMGIYGAIALLAVVISSVSKNKSPKVYKKDFWFIRQKLCIYRMNLLYPLF